MTQASIPASGRGPETDGEASGGVLAFDVGNSKTDVALVRSDGGLLAALRGPTASHQVVGFGEAFARIHRLSQAACRDAEALGRPDVRILVDCTAGADFADEERAIARGLRGLAIAPSVVVLNDTFAALRAGTSRPYGVAVVCGAGINCAAVSPDGRRYRFPALGEISGDWGGATAMGSAALSAAVRARDGRGPRTILERRVPRHFGLRRPTDLTEAIYRGRLEQDRLRELAPLVFDVAAEGDAVSGAIVDRLADEIVTMAAAAIRQLRLVRVELDVVLAGGIFRTEQAGFYERIRAGLERQAPRAQAVRLAAPPVLGAGLIGLDALGGGPEPAVRLRRELTFEAIRPAGPSFGADAPVE